MNRKKKDIQKKLNVVERLDTDDSNAVTESFPNVGAVRDDIHSEGEGNLLQKGMEPERMQTKHGYCYSWNIRA
jgi:hypothetical protein